MGRAMRQIASNTRGTDGLEGMIWTLKMTTFELEKSQFLQSYLIFDEVFDRRLNIKSCVILQQKCEVRADLI
ncbi:hypothetical protein KIN20_019816 [Parelaphostrongylus tenuis]|uniref:Uncharacterized protein n=1 Tax=Parelaphostrongylus tenuis TaxID=148309 RepID=A0AAD5QSR0_PARTN|nr:hypothetical protein KIN20_019816 [Parelaphostrongylus tenuis]